MDGIMESTRLYHVLILSSACFCPKKDKVNIWDASYDTLSSNRKRLLRTMNFRHLSRSRAELLRSGKRPNSLHKRRLFKKGSPWRKFTSSCLFFVQLFPLVRRFSLHDFVSANSFNWSSDCEYEGHSWNRTTSCFNHRCSIHIFMYAANFSVTFLPAFVNKVHHTHFQSLGQER